MTDNRGISLIEAILGLGLFSVIMVVTTLLLSQATTVWRKTSSTDSASGEMRKVQVNLARELGMSSATEVALANTPASLPAGAPDGSAVWFLMSVDPSTGEPVRRTTGAPFWQRNILYYAVVPQGHDAFFGQSCQGGTGALGVDNRCPHKVLIRKEIDLPPTTTTTDETTLETLIPAGSISPYLNRPVGFDTGALGSQARVIAVNLLSFSVQRGPDSDAPGELKVVVEGAATALARKAIRVGTDPMGSFTLTRSFSVFPKNQ